MLGESRSGERAVGCFTRLYCYASPDLFGSDWKLRRRKAIHTHKVLTVDITRPAWRIVL